MKRHISGLALVAVLVAASTAGAVTKTWYVDAGGSWAVAANWSPAVVPATGDDVVLGDCITALRNLTLSTNYSLIGLTVNNTNSGSFYDLNSSSTSARTITLTGAGTNLTVGALGANLCNPNLLQSGLIAFTLPTANNVTWDIGGPTRVGSINGGTAATTSFTKVGTGVLTYMSVAGANSASGYLGNLNINQGEFNVLGIHGNSSGFTMTPTMGSDVTLSGNGWLMMATAKLSTINGADGDYAIIAPGATSAAGSIGQFRLAGTGLYSAKTTTATVGDLTKYNADVSGARSGYSDQFNVSGTLDLGTGLTTTLNLNPVGGSITGGYVLTSASNTAGLTGTFTTVNGKPAGTTLYYSPRALWLFSDTAPRWTADANGSFSNAANWSTAVAGGTGQSLILPDCITAARTLTLDANTSVKDLMIWSGQRYTLAGGNILTLTSGNMYIDGGATNSAYHDLSGVVLQVGDGITPVTDAVWTSYNASPGGQRGEMRIGTVNGIAGTVVTIDGNNPVLLTGDSSNFLGRYIMSTFDFSGGGGGNGSFDYVKVAANNALGGVGATAELAFPYGAVVFSTTSTQNADIMVDTPTMVGGAAVAIGVEGLNVATLNGNLTGTGALTVGRRTMGTVYGTGTLLVNGPANTLSGDVTVQAGNLKVDGDWTGAGSLTIKPLYTAHAYLKGNGTIGMAAGKTMTLSGYGPTYSGRGHLMPGDDNVIGTLTLGTAGNNVTVLGETVVHMDLAGDTEGLSDLFAVNGNFTIATASTNQELWLQIVDNGLFLNGVYTLVTANAVSGTFDAVYFNGSLVADPTAVGGVGGTHQLIYNAGSIVLDGPALPIPEPATLLLLGTGVLGAIGYARRRRMA